jgi:putative oxidoreductase
MSDLKMGGMCSRLAPHAQSLLRIAAGFIFFTSGTTKTFAWPGGLPPGHEHLPLQLTIGGWLEVIFGALLMLGLLTRLSAFLMSGQMAVAYWQFHAFNQGKLVSVWPTINGGASAAILCFVWLYFAAAGPGPWSVDAMICKPKAATPKAEPPATPT